jgi:hypothetical protein
MCHFGRARDWLGIRPGRPERGLLFQWLIRAEAGCPGTLKRFPVSVTLAPLTCRIEKSWVM